MKKNIFVTTGSVLHFDFLIKLIDSVNFNNKYNIIAQIGKGKYIPKNLKCFKFTTNISKYYGWADIIITHTGGTTLSEICLLNKKAIAISNPLGYKGIYEIAQKFDELGYLKYVDFKNIDGKFADFEKIIRDVLDGKYKFKKYTRKKQAIGQEIIKFLDL